LSPTVDLLLLGQFHVAIRRSRDSLDGVGDIVHISGDSSIGDADLPLHGGANSPNGGGGSTGHRPVVVFTSSWSHAVAHGGSSLHGGG
jgi:hypothetical protein